MAFRLGSCSLVLASLAFCGLSPLLRAQVFVVGEKTAMADVSTDFRPTRVELPTTPITERGRRELIRDLESEQGFAHRALPLGDDLILVANGNLRPGGDAYKEMLYKKGQSAGPGDRVAITAVVVKADRIVFDLNGGPYLKHRFLRHVELNDTPVVAPSSDEVTGCRITLLFEGGLPDVSAPEVKALLDPIIDFGVKTSGEAYADSLPAFLKDAIDHHDVLVGMNRRMVLAAMGAPLEKDRELLPGSTDQHYEEWIYGQVPQTVRFVRFVGDRVIQVKVAALGKPIETRTENEMQGYLDPEENTRQIAMGDGRPGGEEGSKPPSILKPGEVAPGTQLGVHLPVSTTTDPQNKGGSAPTGTAGSQPGNGPSAQTSGAGGTSSAGQTAPAGAGPANP